MPTAPDFRLYHSNALDVLAGLLAEELRQPAPGASLLAADTILVPQVAMRRWLQASLAKHHGIAANLAFLTPGEFVRQALDANVPGEADDLDAAAMHWALYAALQDARLLAQPALARIRAHLAGGDALKAWSLAGELAGVFEKYQAWRRCWLLRWEGGGDADDAQAVLWRHIARGRQYRARRIQRYLDGFAGEDAPLPSGLPSRLFAFATLNVSPDVLRVIATQARAGTLHFYLPSPSREYWGDLQALARPLDLEAADPFDAAAGDSRLLQAWGTAGRDFMALLGNDEAVRPVGDVHAFPDPLEGGGSLADGLLRRMQHDILHRRAADAATRLPALRTDDPTLQVHACHTRLRELQVLHDQLRGLLDDPRFDPPLQPRDIAVLAPDIDPYLPGIEAVFGHGGGRLPWTVADASPLHGEPLAEVFLRLLGLPVSRFGLGEVLDLLSAAPVAEAAGLDEDAIARLHDWLHAAGARWGLDAGHRQAHGAPADDAYTWQFALDRLLLGHAAGEEADIAGVAALPRLEGSALQALDALLRVLRTLAVQQRAMGEALTPARWRERLLGLLKALLPQTPRQPATVRALERLHALIEAFASDAGKAGFDAAVPIELVRAHFTRVLGEADTRAPLLTGGISFGRMVPMRLLPFRVICVLGMNDGDYPRRDPGAGLNKLTAALGSDARRRGDRSLREDDRFLFLQLFTSAQDVFYASYLGADPRDGSVREPSVLLGDLIDEAARQHVDPAAAARALVVRHPLQPFSPAAFGGDDPRRFSYRPQWQAAAARLGGTRHRLPPWFDGAPLPLATPVLDISLVQLRRFLEAPGRSFIEAALGIREAAQTTRREDIEPLASPGAGLERAQLQRAAFEALLDEDDLAAVHARLRARGVLPSGALGLRVLQRERQLMAHYLQAFRQWRGDARVQRHRLELVLPGVRLHGEIEAWPQGIANLRIGKANGPSVIRGGLAWLLANAAGLALPRVDFHEDALPGVQPPLPAGQALAALQSLTALYQAGLAEPLPFAARSGWAYISHPNPEQGLRNAASQWHGSQNVWAEGRSEGLRLALRGRDPFTDANALLRFMQLSASIFAAVGDGVVLADEDLATCVPDGFETDTGGDE